MKIIDKIRAEEKKGAAFFSFEYFPPKTPAGVKNLCDRADRMGALQPLFVGVTCGTEGSTADLTLDICSHLCTTCCLETQLHLTCTNFAVESVVAALTQAKKAGIQNVLACRGDKSTGKVETGLTHTVDLVKLIRETFGDYFSIAVTGHPEGHSEDESYESGLEYLKAKVDAGADYIITGLFYDVDVFIKYVNDCRSIGITCPILPGIMPINTYASFKRMSSSLSIPKAIAEAIDPLKDDDEAVKCVGVEIGIEMCRRLLASGLVPGLYFYTMNLEKSVTQILEDLGLVQESVNRRSLPFRPRINKSEEVRPIFWANRPKSYLSRTTEWDEYPNGRWGDNRSPAFGSLRDYHLAPADTSTVEDRKKEWGSNPTTEQDIYNVFAAYVQGNIQSLPWSEGPLAIETQNLIDVLTRLNSNGFLTINSQPRVNAASSSDPAVGWGGPNGYVYQKAYVELFASPDKFSKLVDVIKTRKSISYTAVNQRGETHTSINSPVIALTWGVFPNKEIIQPTVMCKESFLVWKDEAFALWKSQWESLYEPGSPSHSLIKHIRETYYLVNIVDNDFVSGDVFSLFDDLTAAK